MNRIELERITRVDAYLYEEYLDRTVIDYILELKETIAHNRCLESKNDRIEELEQEVDDLEYEISDLKEQISELEQERKELLS